MICTKYGIRSHGFTYIVPLQLYGFFYIGSDVFVSNYSNRTFNDDTKLSKQTSHKESYNNEAFEKDDNRKVATVDPTIHSLGGSEDDEQLNPNHHSQIRKGDEHITVKDHTDTL